MASIWIPPFAPSPMSSNRFARNGALPNPMAWRRIGGAFNALATYQKRHHFSYAYSISSGLPGAVTGNVRHLRFPIRTGLNVARVKILVGLAPRTTASGIPKVSVEFTDAVPTTVSSTSITPALLGSSAFTPANMTWGLLTCDELADNTSYLARVLLTNYARLQCCCCWEESDTAIDTDELFAVDTGRFQVGSQIVDSSIEDCLVAGTRHWQKAAAPLVVWSRRSDSTSPVISSTSYINVLNNSSTSVSANTPGFSINLPYHTTRARTTVPLMMAIDASRVTGTGTLSFRFTDGTNSIATTGLTPTSPFATVTGTLPTAAATKYDVQAAVTSGTWSINSFALWQYEA